MKKIPCDIVSKQDINSKQNIKGALPVKDKNAYMWKTVAYTNKPRNPKTKQKGSKQDNVDDFSNANVFC